MIIEKTPNTIILQKSQLLDEIIKLGEFSFHYHKVSIPDRIGMFTNHIQQPFSPSVEIQIKYCPENIIEKTYELYDKHINSNIQ